MVLNRLDCLYIQNVNYFEVSHMNGNGGRGYVMENITPSFSINMRGIQVDPAINQPKIANSSGNTLMNSPNMGRAQYARSVENE